MYQDDGGSIWSSGSIFFSSQSAINDILEKEEFDLNDNGTIEARELFAIGQARRTAGQKASHWTAAKNEAMLAHMDTNCSGTVSQSEFVQYFNVHLPQSLSAFDETIQEFKVAAVLAEDSVREAAKNVTPEAIGSDESFFPLVFQPCMQLAKTQLPILSSGWGRGAFLGSSESSPSTDSLGVLTCRVALI